jgi:hypothetical protein
MINLINMNHTCKRNKVSCKGKIISHPVLTKLNISKANLAYFYMYIKYLYLSMYKTVKFKTKEFFIVFWIGHILRRNCPL